MNKMQLCVIHFFKKRKQLTECQVESSFYVTTRRPTNQQLQERSELSNNLEDNNMMRYLNGEWTIYINFLMTYL